MTVDQYEELIQFLAKQFGRVDERFQGIEGRLGGLEGRMTKVEVSLEALRGDVQLLAEGLSATNERLDRYHQDHEIRLRSMENRWLEN